jgi:hypothetical protein
LGPLLLSIGLRSALGIIVKGNVIVNERRVRIVFLGLAWRLGIDAIGQAGLKG